MYNGPDDLSQDAFDRANDQYDSETIETVELPGEEPIILLNCGHIGLARFNEFCPRCYTESLEDHNSL
jgi:hypothetical protein